MITSSQANFLRFSYGRYLCGVLALLLAILFPLASFAAVGVPKIINYQGRLLDANGALLGGSAGTNYCFRFGIYDSATNGSKLWPSGSPATTTVSVKNGLFAYGIGSGAGGGDTSISYNFNDSDTIYLQVEVAPNSGGACSASSLSWETLSPRKQVYASGYAINASTVGGYTPAQSATGNQVPVLTSGNLILGATNPQLNASGSNALVFQGGAGTGDIQFFNSANKITSAGALAAASATFSSTLAVTGASTLTGLATLNGGASTTNASLSGALWVGGNATTTSAGALSLGSTLTVTGASTLTGAATLSSTLGVTGLSTLTGGFLSQASSTVVGNMTITGNATTSNATTTNLAISSLTAGSIPFAITGGAIIQNNANLFWDNANKRLGIGTNSPTNTLMASSTGVANALATSAVFSADAGTFTAAQRVGLGTLLGFNNDSNTEFAAIGADCPSDCTNNQSRLDFWTENSATTFTTSNPSMVINNLGNVGIGTTTPQTKLVVAGGSMSGAVPTAGTTLTLDSTGSDNFLTILANSNNNASVIFGSNTSVLTGAVGYNNSTNKMSFNTNGNNVRMTLDGSGNLGIGSTTPAQLFSVAGNGYLTGGLGVGLTNTTAGSLQTSGAATIGGAATLSSTLGVTGLSTLTGGFLSQASSTVVGNFTTTGTANTLGTITSGTWNGSTVGLAYGGTATTTFYSGGLVFSDGSKLTQAANSGAGTLFWDNTNGKLGIGTTTPQGFLNVAAVAPAIFITDNNAGANLKHWALQSAAGNFNLGTVGDGLGPIATKFNVQNNGNVGVGTSTASTLLAVSGSGAAMLVSGTPGTEGEIQIQSNRTVGGVTSRTWRILSGTGGASPNQNFRIYDNYAGADRVNIDSSGNLGIGTTSPAQLFSVAGNGYLTGGLGVGLTNTTAGSLQTSGAATIGGAATLSSTLGVTGLSTLTGGFLSQASSTVVGNFTTTGTANTLGTITSGTWNGSTVGLAYGGTATTTFYSGGLVFSDGSKLTQAANSGAGTLFWDNTNNRLGIGSTSPAQTLSVAGKVYTTGGIQFSDGSLQTAAAAAAASALQGQTAFYNTNGTTVSGTSTIFITQAGNVGIGSTTPAQLFSVAGNGYLTGGLGVGLTNTTAGSLQTSGAATIGGAATLSSTLGVTGLSTLTGGFLSQASSTVAGGLTTLAGGASTTNASLSGALWVGGNATTTSAGALSLGSTLTVTGNATLSGTANSIGTVTSGTWNGTTIAVANGGTGVTTSTGSGSVVLGTSPTFTTGLTLNTNSLTSGIGLSVSSAQGSTANLLTGTTTAISYTKTYNGAGGTESGNTLDIYRSLTSSGSGTLTVNGAVARIIDVAGGSSGLTHSADVLQIKQGYTSNSGAALDVTTAGTGLALRVNHNGTFSDSKAFVVDANGYVGIGTASAGASGLNISSNASGAGVTVTNTNTSADGFDLTVPDSSDSHNAIFVQNGGGTGVAMTLFTSGKLSVGYTAISGTNTITSGGNASIGSGYTSNTAPSNGLIVQGNVGFGTASPSYQLQLGTDSAAKPGTNTWTIASDRRLKTNISPFVDGLSVLEQVAPVNYTYNGLAGLPAGYQGIGVIAQDIQSVAPYTVNTYYAKLNNDDATTTQLYNFNSGPLTFVIINAIKELNAKVMNLAGALQVDQNGTIHATSTAVRGHDVTDAYDSMDMSLTPGNLVALSATTSIQVEKATSTTETLLGVVSSDLGLLLGDEEATSTIHVSVAMAGRVATKVNLDDGAITVGDRITVSTSTPGVGMKATSTAQTVGIALEAYDGEPQKNGQIMVLVNLQGKDLAVANTTSGEDDATFAARVLKVFENLGTKFAQGAAWFKDVFASTLEVGTADERTGVTLYDLQTGAPYCLAISGGAQVNLPGKCPKVLPGVPSPSSSAPANTTPINISTASPASTSTSTINYASSTTTSPVNNFATSTISTGTASSSAAISGSGTTSSATSTTSAKVSTTINADSVTSNLTSAATSTITLATVTANSYASSATTTTATSTNP